MTGEASAISHLQIIFNNFLLVNNSRISITGEQQGQQQQFSAPYSYATYPPGYTVQGYAAHHLQQPGAAKTMAQIYPAPGGYYIAGTAGPTATNKSGGGSVSSGSPAPSYIYGPYGAYPYGSGRVIGPIIAIGQNQLILKLRILSRILRWHFSHLKI